MYIVLYRSYMLGMVIHTNKLLAYSVRPGNSKGYLEIYIIQIR